ncbi:MAG: MFS transporter, partial [Deltaproteobacteria bacterium]|nr:MFS transporter [Deltaproteobacteria bacterium]
MAAPDQPSTPSWLRDFILLSISRFCMFFSHRQVQPVFPVYLSSLGASATLIGFVMSSFTVMATASRPLIGMLMDRSGRKVFLIMGLSLFALTALGYAWAPTIMILVLFRILQGLGWSLGTTAVATLSADIAPSNK